MSEKELLFSLTKKDFEIEWYSGTGGGGQHRNKHDNCCRLRHPASGAVAQCQDHRSRVQNQKVAFQRLLETKKFQAWHKVKISECMSMESVSKKVDRMMAPKNLKLETMDSGKWKESIDN